MPRTIYSKQIAAILNMPVFGVKDLAGRGVPPAYARQRLHLMSVSGRIARIERGKYTATADPVLVATHVTEPCYLSLWSALNYRGLTDQIPFSVQVVTSRKRFARKLTFASSEIRFYYVRPGMMFGYEQVPFGEGHRIPIAKAEKTIIDAIYLNGMPLEDLGKAMDSADPALLMEYSQLTGNRHVIAAVKELLKC